MRQDNRFEQTDKDALHMALLALRQCPICRRPLRQCIQQENYAAVKIEHEWGCVTCDRGWNVTDGKEVAS